MKEKIIFVAVVIIIFLFLMIREPPEPKEFTNDKVVLNYSNLFFNYKIIRYPTSAEILPLGENIKIGFITDPWNLKFGTAPGNGSYIKRFISISNSNERYNKVELKTYGNITPLIKFNKNNFLLEVNKSIAVEVTLFTDSADPGNYSGEIDIIMKIPKYDFLSSLM